MYSGEKASMERHKLRPLGDVSAVGFLVFTNLLDEPAKKVGTGMNTVLPVGAVDCFSSLGGVAGYPASAAFTGQCTTPKLIAHSGR